MPEQKIEEKTIEIIKQLKVLKEEKGLKLKDIFNLVNPDGIQYVSESTIRRIFQEGSENVKFDYETSVQPIARALLGMNEDDAFNPDNAQIYYEQRNGLQEVVRLHNAEIKRLRTSIEEQRGYYQQRLEMDKTTRAEEIENIKAVYDERCRCQRTTIDNLQQTNAFLEEMIRRLIEGENSDRNFKWELHNQITELQKEIGNLKQFHKHEE